MLIGERLADIGGIIGSLMIVIGYTMTVLGSWNPKSPKFLLFNLAAALLLLWSLYYTPNKGSILIELFWIGVSLYGLFKYWKEKKVR